MGGELPEATIIENPDADITEKVNNIFSTTYSSHLQRINTDIPEKIKHIPMRNTGIGGTNTSVENIPFPTNEIQFRTLSIILVAY